MSAQEFGEWMSFFQHEQLHPQATWRRHAQLLAATHNGPLVRKDGAFWHSADFVPTDPWAPPVQMHETEPAASAATLAAQVESLNRQIFDA